jgi:NAD(P)-dependent dehydrogenase (short-subunit alcohol dehydrogenase family)
VPVPLAHATQLIGNRPIKHNGQPEDIASIVSYLASKEAHFITGEPLFCHSFSAVPYLTL